VHVQLDLSNYNVAVIDTTNEMQPGLTVAADAYSLDNKLLLHREEKIDVSADSVTNSFILDLPPLLRAGKVIFVKLQVHGTSGDLISQNFYWLGADSATYQTLTRIPLATLSLTAHSSKSEEAGEQSIRVELKNTGAVASLMNKITLLHASDQSRILPAYYSDNYVSLLPGESREIAIEYPASAGQAAPRLEIRGWNLTPQAIPITGGH